MSRSRPTAQAGQLDAFYNDAAGVAVDADPDYVPEYLAGNVEGNALGNAPSVAGDYQDADGSDCIASRVDVLGGQPLPAGEPLVMRSLWVSLENGEQLHLRHFLPALEPLADTSPQPGDWRGDAAETAILQRALAGANGRSVFMLHGEAECGRVFYDSSHRGLARYLARRGYEVFVADLGGRGRSLVPGGAQSTLSVNQLVSQAIPALLRSAARYSVLPASGTAAERRGPDVWIAHGFGAVLLSATWARLAEHERCAQQWVFFAGRRRFAARQRWARIFVKLCCHPLSERWVGWRNLFPATRLGLGSADENASWFRTYAQWMHARAWRDNVDEFDYQRALTAAPVPATLHLAAAGDEVFSNLEDIREFIAELGPHDARLLVVDRIGQGKRRYNHLAMLLDDAAESDVFEPLDQWLAQAGSCHSSAALYSEVQAVAAHSGDTAAAPQVEAHYSSERNEPERSVPERSVPERSAPQSALVGENKIAKPSASSPGQREVQVELYYNLPEAEPSASITADDRQVQADDVEPPHARAS